MKCDGARELLSAGLDGELVPTEAEALARHLAACPDCAAEGERLAAVRAAFRALPPAAPPRDLADAVMARIRAGEAGAPGDPAHPLAPPPADPASRRWPAAARLAAALALAAAGLGAAWLARAREAPAPPAPALPVAATAAHDLGADAGCEATGDCLALAPCDSPMECGGGPPCSNPGECGGAGD